MEALKSAIKQLPEKGQFTSEADALAFAVHACLEKDGCNSTSACLWRLTVDRVSLRGC